MKKWIGILGGLLALQLVLVVAMNLADDDYDAFEADEKLLPFNAEAANRLQFDDGTQHVTLEKQDGQWVLSDTWNYPADTDALNKLMKKLSALNKGWPVATTSGAAERFKVADKDFDRKITFMSGDKKKAVLYIGTAPGFRQAHARLKGDDDIFVVAVESWEISAQPDHWLRKDILRINPQDIDRLAMADFVLTRVDQTLQPDNLSEYEKPDSDAINNLVGRLTGLQIQSVLGIEGSENSEAYQLSEPVLEIDFTLKQGESIHYRFSKSVYDSNHYILKRSDLPYYFSIADFSVDGLKETGRSALVEAYDVHTDGDGDDYDDQEGGIEDEQ